MQVEEKYSEELIEYIKDMAKFDYETGHPMDSNDVSEFRHILRDDDFTVSLDEAKELFNYYFEIFDLCRERDNNAY